MTPMAALASTLAAVLGVGWLAFLALGRTRGSLKRLALRGTLVAAGAALIRTGRRTGTFAQVGPGRHLVLLALVALVALSYLYLIRFCSSCGRMHRNFKLAACARCGAPLPEHGLTVRPRRAPPPPSKVTPTRRSRTL